MRPRYSFSSKYKKRILLFRLILVFTVLAFLVLCLSCVTNQRLTPLIHKVAEAKAKETALKVINESIYRRLSEGETTYDSLSEIKYDSNGKVSLIKSKISQINEERSKISLYILSTYKDTDMVTNIPAGTISGIDILSGMGPNISVKLSSAPAISTDVYNEFIDAGINQTLHRIMLKISIDTTVMVPSSTFTVNTTSSVCIAETIIVGDIPDAYTEIHRGQENITESDIDDIYDFGATLDN
ncbi:MAG: sporulation protein YunB [Clostridia bacterium]|nr:sporulation protein YunB [Clostridia bacterium]